MTACPTCTSREPHLHPCLQFEGEVAICRDPFHLTITSQNTPERIADVAAMIQAEYARGAP